MIRTHIVILLLLLGGTAHADGPLQCKDIAKGDVAACTAKVKAQCTQEKYWDKRACEQTIVMSADACLNGQYEAACKAASRLRPACDAGYTSGSTLAQLFNQAFVDKYNKSKEASAQYLKFDQQWSACYRSEFDTKLCSADSSDASDCKRAPEAFRELFTEEIDEMITRNWTTSADAQLMLDINAKLKAELRYKEKELQKIVDRHVEADKKAEADRVKAIASSRCRKGGKSASSAFQRLARDFYDGFEDDGDFHRKIRSVRLFGGTSRWVDQGRLITRESMPAEICSEYIDKDKKQHCSAEKISFYREKAPASPWSSWMVATSGTAEVSCK